MSRDERRFEITTALEVQGLTPAELQSFADRLHASVLEASKSFPSVVAFFVGTAEEDEVEVGLRIQGVNPTELDRIATQVIDDALDLVQERGAGVSPKPSFVGSQLVVA
ncbi:hypothetical protein C5E07_13065 [Pseudoclavibacter sp. RFBJ3]|uniref:hypothetical protein n=1 Tax=unclassified Pseudoclavibacter TaxID=2615177 RepID=UPI000CE79908|nr:MULTISPECIES: hypothetical protein [unclassified Pseudoclavibacter]PPF82621.1 hypothetical protein C5C12_12140 [Pseudoclavibacter sp. RFBJ5]PPF91515.1 hypothetical protein C5E07_13065 [Pseudoclavibacter sp. RFBJ3]PPF96438.1 hypothetical protein C5C19_15755 [Pseudoclavibacter sp. RFBH5]PPG22183.1 hypothetical protein C5E13_12390 [Pseudoclavibacter sp. RFBI4]